MIAWTKLNIGLNVMMFTGSGQKDLSHIRYIENSWLHTAQYGGF